MTATIIQLRRTVETEWCYRCGRTFPLSELRQVDGVEVCRPCRLSALGHVLIGDR